MVLDINVPERIKEHFKHIVFPFLERNNLSIDDVDHLIFHPGGKKIIPDCGPGRARRHRGLPLRGEDGAHLQRRRTRTQPRDRRAC